MEVVCTAARMNTYVNIKYTDKVTAEKHGGVVVRWRRGLQGNIRNLLLFSINCLRKLFSKANLSPDFIIALLFYVLGS